MVNAGRILIIAQGEWSNLISYGQLDLVSRNQIAYLARRASVGVDPVTDTDMTYWQPFGTVSDIATTTTPGLVMPDGTTITIDATGLIKANVGISDITNVAISSIANNQVLIYNSTTQKWENKTLSAAGVTYNNTGSGLSASTAQAAIDEVNTKSNKAYKTDDSIEASIATNDYIPFYDTSASAKKRILKSNLVPSVNSTLSSSSTSPVQNKVVSKALGTVETIGGTASKAYSTGDLMLASTGQLYSVTADISQGGSITSGGNVEATDGIVSQISNLSKYNTELYYGFGVSNSNGFILVTMPSEIPSGSFPIGAISNDNGVITLLAYKPSSSSNTFYIKCFNWDMSILANTTVGFYVMFASYKSNNLN